MRYELHPVYDARQSFYCKAMVEDNRLYSYGVLVCEIEDGQPKVYNRQNGADTLTTTTLRHIKEFLKQNGFIVNTKKDVEKFITHIGEKTHGFNRAD